MRLKSQVNGTYLTHILTRWSAALPSMLGSRLLLNMREIVSRQSNKSYILESFGPTSTIPFDKELGSPLSFSSETEAQILHDHIPQ